MISNAFHKRFTLLLIVIAIVISGVLSWYYMFDGWKWIAYDFHDTHEPLTFETDTTQTAIYTDQQIREVLEKYTYLSDHYDLDQVVKDSIVIPGLKAALSLRDYENDSAGPDVCTSMTPQGITLNDRYILISAFCNTGRHHSVIFVVDRNSGEYLKTIVLFDKSHVGSVAIDDNHDMVWVCCHDDASGYAYVRGFTLQAMEEYDFSSGQPIVFTANYPVKTQKRASFMTCYDNCLYIGYFNRDIRSEFTVQRFDISDDGSLIVYPNVDKQKDSEPDTVIMPVMKEVINGGMQGYARNDTHTVILRSYGSSNPSRLLMFDQTSDDIGTLDLTDNNAVINAKLPPMAEEASLDGNDLYICFESAAYAYRARKCDHIDRILVFKQSAMK
ncbi:MAG: hypothetical protein ACI32N_02565 [Bulleidia sp.]